MSFCFLSFNHPSNISCCVNKDSSRSRGTYDHALLKLPSSNRTSRHRNFSGPLIIGQGNGIGILGGVLVDSGLNFAKKLLNLKSEIGETGPPFILCSDPASSDWLSSHDHVHVDHSSVIENLRRKRVFLEKSGVCCIAMPCNMLHSWHDEIKEGCSVPFLHIVECMAKELKEAKLRPLEAGSPLRIGVLATNGARVTKLYQEKLKNEDFEVVLPDKATMEHIVIPAVEALSRKDTEGAQNLFRVALQVLLVRAVNRVVVASDELSTLLPADDPLWAKCIDPTDALARSALKCLPSVGRG